MALMNLDWSFHSASFSLHLSITEIFVFSIHGMSWIKKNKEYIKPNQKITNILLYKKHFKRYFMIHSKAGTPVQAIAEKIYAVLFQVNK